ncbi:hypothetical protein [Rhodopirellula islandica]|uniref:hypothetical protein n=1 Tax=Rhodopirellula islandica TaxID=595434 RepID=UPI00064AA5C8|nr:hypothetical protein [Rhodopirellula islandica]
MNKIAGPAWHRWLFCIVFVVFATFVTLAFPIRGSRECDPLIGTEDRAVTIYRLLQPDSTLSETCFTFPLTLRDAGCPARKLKYMGMSCSCASVYADQQKLSKGDAVVVTPAEQRKITMLLPAVDRPTVRSVSVVLQDSERSNIVLKSSLVLVAPISVSPDVIDEIVFDETGQCGTFSLDAKVTSVSKLAIGEFSINISDESVHLMKLESIRSQGLNGDALVSETWRLAFKISDVKSKPVSFYISLVSHEGVELGKAKALLRIDKALERL